MLNLLLFAKIPMAQWVEVITDWITRTFSGLFSFLQTIGQVVMNSLTSLFLVIPPIILIIVITVVAYYISNHKKGLPIFTFLGLLFIYNQGLWENLMSTFTLVLIASLLSIIIGVPLGILMAKNDKAQAIIFALPPTVRFTNLGIRQVPEELVEAADSFGSTGSQKLFKLELPLAKSTILAGINQTTMLALSMVVIASMIGAPGLGRDVLSALQRAQVGNGFVSGLALVILAIIIDRFTQYLNKPNSSDKDDKKKMKKSTIITIIVAILVAFGIYTAVSNHTEGDKSINLAYVEWDSEVASTHVVAEVLKDQGYDVEVTPLDNAIMWQSLATGKADASVSAWLPNTHQSQLEEYQDDINLIGDNLTGARVGLVVPTYMGIKSIDDLNTQAGQKIIGIKPDADVVNAAEETIQTYPNLKDWTLDASSSGSMVVALDQAIKKEEPIVITGWTPHWMFSKYDLTYLEDPKGTMGEEETINTMTRKDLQQDSPEAFAILEKFHWTPEDLEVVMLDIDSGASPEQAAKKWVQDNPDKVAKWTN